MKKLKKILAVILSAVMLVGAVPIFSLAETSEYSLCDVNGDGYATAADARLALRRAALLEYLSDEANAAADINGDGKVTAADSRMIIRYSAMLNEIDSAAPRPEIITSDRSSSDTKITMTSGDAIVGQEVTISVSAENTKGLESADLVLTYDYNALEYVSVKKDTASEFSLAEGGYPASGTVTFSFAYYDACETDSTSIAQITFKVLKAGDSDIICRMRSWDGTDIPKDATLTISAHEPKPVEPEPITELEYLNITTEDGFDCTVCATDGTAVITKYTGSETELDIPSEIDGYAVTRIGYWAFNNCTTLEKVIIPDNIEYADNGSFWGCCNLTTVYVGSGLKNFGYNSFMLCSNLECFIVSEDNQFLSNDSDGILYDKDKTHIEQFPCGNKITSFTVPESVTAIYDQTFYDCKNLKSVMISDNVTYIGWCAFCGCDNLTDVVIGCGVERIDMQAFDGTEKLKEITVDEKNPYFSNDEYGALFNKNKTKLFRCPSAYSESLYKIPDGVEAIEDCAFEGCNNITSLIIPKSVSEIGDYSYVGYYDGNDGSRTWIDGFIIYGVPGSAAEEYANKNGITFIDVADMPVDEPTTGKTDKPTPPADDSDRITMDESNKLVTVSMDGSKESLSAADFKASLGNENVKIVDKDGNELGADALVGTGAKVQLLGDSGNVILEYEVIVPSDVNGDGKTTAADARIALRASARLDDISGVYSIAADMSGDEKITAADARKILRKSAGLE